MKKIDLKNLDKGTIIRTVAQALAYCNQLVALIGKTSFATAEWYQWASLIVTFLTTALSWWFNNDYTAAAKWGTKVLYALQDGTITEDEVKDLLGESEEEKK